MIDPLLPSEGTLRRSAERLEKETQRMKNLARDDRDYVALMTGKERKGKSTLAFQFARKLDDDFNIQKQTAWSAPSYTRQCQALPKGKPAVLDELITGGFSRDHSSPANKHLAKWFTIGGTYNLAHFLCWPNRRWADPILREHRVDREWHVVRRFRDYAVAQCIQLVGSDGNPLAKPRVLFPFVYQDLPPEFKAEYQRLKKIYADSVSRGTDEQADEEEVIRRQIKQSISPVLRRYRLI